MDISCNFLGKKLKSPLVLPAGVLGMTASSLLRVVNSGAGMVTTKSISLKPRTGHKGPVIAEFKAGIINSMGVPNPGIDEGLKEIELFKTQTETPLIVSIFGLNLNEFVELTRKVNYSKTDFLELNISCPNVSDENVSFHNSMESIAKIVSAVKKISKKPVIVKLPPDKQVKQIAKILEGEGADAFALINSLGPGMIIDVKTGKPVLHNKFGGVSGPAIKPIAVKFVYDIREATNLPLIGMGGVTTGEDAVEMIMAGAQCVGIGAGIYYRGIEIFSKVNREIKKFMKQNGYNNLNEFRGKAHNA